MRSGSRLERCLHEALSRRCGVRMYSGKGRTLAVIGRCVPGLIVSSVVVPRVEKSRLYRVLGGSVRASRVPVVLLATLGASGGVVRKLRDKTSRCVIGPFGVNVLQTGVTGLLAGQTLLHRGCTDLSLGSRGGGASYVGYSGSLS